MDHGRSYSTSPSLHESPSDGGPSLLSSSHEPGGDFEQDMNASPSGGGREKYERYVEMKKNLYLMQSLQTKDKENGNRDELSEEFAQKFSHREREGSEGRKVSSPAITRSASYSSPDASERYGASLTRQHSPYATPYSSLG
jgi:hypothetical protein